MGHDYDKQSMVSENYLGHDQEIIPYMPSLQTDRQGESRGLDSALAKN